MAIVVFTLLGEWGWRNKAIANFYLAPTRAWELLVGSVAAFIVRRDGINKNNLLSIFGLIAIAFSMFAYDYNTPFPSFYTLVPVIGAALIILHADEDTLVSQLLSTKVLVGLGLLSYSAYLWHQPFFAFARVGLSTNPSKSLKLLPSIVTIVLSYLSWKYIEIPFRDKNRIQRHAIFAISVTGMSFFISIGLSGIRTDGFDGRYPQSDLQFLGQINDGNPVYVTQRFQSLRDKRWDVNKTKVFLVGDSYAEDLTNAICEVGLNETFSVRTWGMSAACGNLLIPIEEKTQYMKSKDLPRCISRDYYQEVRFRELLSEADEVWFASSWKPWQAELLGQSLSNVRESTDAVISVFGRKEFPSFNPRKYLGLTQEQRANFAEPADEEKINLNDKLKQVAVNYNFIDVQKLMCGGNVRKCKIFDKSGYLKTFDGGHLTREGARFYGQALQNRMTQSQNRSHNEIGIW